MYCVLTVEWMLQPSISDPSYSLHFVWVSVQSSGDW